MSFKKTNFVFLLVVVLEHFRTGGAIDPDWVTEALRRHNQFRRGFSSPPLLLNDTLCSSSLTNALELATHEGKLVHNNSLDFNYGENIYTTTDPNILIYGTTPVDAWYNGIRYYNFEIGKKVTGDLDTGVGNSPLSQSQQQFFTQVIWKSTRYFCISYAASPPSKSNDSVSTVYIVAHYLPRGNTFGEELSNVTPFMSNPYYYKDSESAPNWKHLSDPIGSDGKSIEIHQRIPDRNCWDNSNHTASKVTTSKEYIRKALHGINSLRRHHKVSVLPQLGQNSALCKSAQGWANWLANSSTLKGESTNENSKCGQMLHKSNQFLTSDALIKIWYNEGLSYEFDHHRTSSGYSPGKTNNLKGNFVRLIWKDTEQMCIVYAEKESTKEYIYVGFLYQNSKANYENFEARKSNVFNFAIQFGHNFCILIISTLLLLL